jgi:hypothetical protein
MADLTKLKRWSSLGEPPTPAEASANPEAAETAPPAVSPARRTKLLRPKPGQGRACATRRSSAHRSGRTCNLQPVSVRSSITGCGRSPSDGKLLVEVLEKAPEAYETSRQTRDRDSGYLAATSHFVHIPASSRRLVSIGLTLIGWQWRL